MPRKSKQSPVLAFLTLAWQNATKGVPFSYARINHTMSRAGAGVAATTKTTTAGGELARR